MVVCSLSVDYSCFPVNCLSLAVNCPLILPVNSSYLAVNCVFLINWLLSGESNRPLTPIHAKKYRDTPPISMAYFCKSMPSLWQKVVYTPPICITIRLPFVSRYFCGSIRVRGRWDTPNVNCQREVRGELPRMAHPRQVQTSALTSTKNI